MQQRAKIACAILSGLTAWLLSGCGLVLQGRTSKLSVTTTPPDTTVSVAGKSYSAPAAVELPRNAGGVVVRARQDGYLESCRVVDVQTTRLLVALDAVPLGLGLVIDRLAGTWPSEYAPVQVALSPAESGGEATPLPPDPEILIAWRNVGIDRCAGARTPFVRAKLEKRIAHFRPALTSVRVQGKVPLGVTREETDDVFVFHDDAIAVEVIPEDLAIQLSVENRMSRSVKIRWDEAVFVDFDHTSNAIAHREKGGSDASGVHSNISVIAPGTTVQTSVSPVSRTVEVTRAIRTSDAGCVQQCQQSIYQCMAAFNCSGYRSHVPYTGQGWMLFAIADGIDAGLCERRCLDQGQACVGSCVRVSGQREAQQLPIVPTLLRPCSQSEDEFDRAAQSAEPETYAVLLPIEVSGTVREYTLNFKGEFFQYGLDQGCPVPR